LTDRRCRARLLVLGLEKAMRDGTSYRVADCRRVRADTQPTSSSAGLPESRAPAGRGLPRTVLNWLARVLTGCAIRPRPDYPRAAATAFEDPAWPTAAAAREAAAIAGIPPTMPASAAPTSRRAVNFLGSCARPGAMCWRTPNRKRSGQTFLARWCVGPRPGVRGRPASNNAWASQRCRFPGPFSQARDASAGSSPKATAGCA
jgi:hypothetical protein